MADNQQQTLQQGIEAARRGDRNTGRRLLREVIETDPNNELAWIWLASCMTTADERRECLRRVLEINPNNTRAKQALAALEGQGQPSPQTAQPATRQSRGGLDVLNLAIVLLAVIAIIGGLFLFSDLGPLNQEPPTLTRAPATRIPPPSLTPTPFPTRAPVLFEGTSNAPTLPPTFTPTPSPRPSATSTPTVTPFPVESFDALYTSLREDAAEPDLFRIMGDGSGEQRVPGGFRDVAYDLAGNRIAFVRDVEYPPDDPEAEDAVTEIYPELFVADLDDLNNPRRITEIRTAIVASPSWSPDGSGLAFVNDFNGSEDIWFVTPDGPDEFNNNLRRLTENDNIIDRDPAWEPVEGSLRILFASDRDSIGTTEIYSFELYEPGTEPVFERITNSNNSSYAPAWAHNGSQVAFVSDRSGDADIYVMNPDGSGQRLLTNDDGGAEDRSPGYTPDGRYVAFVSNRVDARFQSYLVSVDGAVLVRVTNNEHNDTGIVYQPRTILRLRGSN